MPADGSGEEERLRAFQGSNACAFGVPLVPADQRADVAGSRRECPETKVTRREVELFIIERIIRNMHLAIHVCDAAIALDGDRGVVVQAGRAALKQGSDYDHVVLPRNRGEALSARPGNRLGRCEQRMIFALTEVLCTEEFRQAHEFGTGFGRIRNALCRFVEILLRIGFATHLDERDLCLLHIESFLRAALRP